MNINPFVMMGNSPMTQLLRAAQSGGNPMQTIQQMAQRNPQMMQGMQIVQGKSQQQLEQTARNMARERGVDVNQILNTLGIKP